MANGIFSTRIPQRIGTNNHNRGGDRLRVTGETSFQPDLTNQELQNGDYNQFSAVLHAQPVGLTIIDRNKLLALTPIRLRSVLGPRP